MKRIVGTALIAIVAVLGLTACMGDDDGGSAQQQRRTAAIGVAGAVGHDYQLSLDGITVAGEVIQVESFSFGVENPTTIGSATSGAGAGKIKFNEFTIVKSVDKATPKLYEAVARGQHSKTAVLTLQKSSSGKPIPYLVVTLNTVFITNVDYAGSNPDHAKEVVKMVYGTLKTEYKGQSATGAAEAPVSFGWDQVTNTMAP